MCAAGVVLCCRAVANPTATQSFSLQPGWNAVYLRVDPAEANPGELFAGTPIDIVACYVASKSTAQFLREPDEKPWNDPDWVVWYAPDRPDAFLGNLVSVVGRKPYLIHAAHAFQWSVAGEVVFAPVEWRADSFNLIAFGLDASSPPTFAEFFAGSAAHKDRRFYRLLNGRWSLVTNPATARMAPDEPYWVYCSGRSGFQGPLNVQAGGGRLLLGPGMTYRMITITNAGVDPATVTIERSGELPLSYREMNLSTLSYTSHALADKLDLPELEAGESIDFHVDVNGGRRTSGDAVLRISHSSGACVSVPVVFEAE